MRLVNNMSDSTLIIGGGVAGIQAALDLAERGLDVYLVEKEPTIGGRMAQLDKIYPTNESSISSLTPKMAECFGHPNILILTESEVEEVTGEVGDFKVKILKNASMVDEAKCTGCGECVEACPVQFAIQLRERPSEPPKVEEPEVIEQIIADNSHLKAPLIPILLEVNDKYRYLPRDVLDYLSFKLDIPLTKILRIATFYTSFSLVPKGKYHFKLCLGTACHVRGSRKVLERLQEIIPEYEKGLFSIETVNCMGACALGPAGMLNEEYLGNLTPAKAEEALKEIASKEDEVEDEEESA